MKQNRRGPAPRSVLIALLPVVLVLLLLNTNLLQTWAAAVSVGGRDYNAIEFRYYFYSAYYDFVNEHSEHLDELGLDVSKSLEKQSYDGAQSWRDYFYELALRNVREDRTLLLAAETRSFDPVDEVDAACARQKEELSQYCMDNGINGLSKYFESYYGSGMTESVYFDLYREHVKAGLYRVRLLDELAPGAAETEARIEALAEQALPTVNFYAARFEPAADRSSGQPEEHQWNNARKQAEAFLAIWQDGTLTAERFAELIRRYDHVSDNGGAYVNVSADTLDPAVADWCFQSGRAAGDVQIVRGVQCWWVILYLEAGQDGRLARAEETLTRERYDAWLSEHDAGEPEIHRLGMKLAF